MSELITVTWEREIPKMEIHIEEDMNGYGVNFSAPLKIWFCKAGAVCDYCRVYRVSAVYLHIIDKLKEANLLEKDHKLICCHCKELINLSKEKDFVRIYNFLCYLKKQISEAGIIGYLENVCMYKEFKFILEIDFKEEKKKHERAGYIEAPFRNSEVGETDPL